MIVAPELLEHTFTLMRHFNPGDQRIPCKAKDAFDKLCTAFPTASANEIQEAIEMVQHLQEVADKLALEWWKTASLNDSENTQKAAHVAGQQLQTEVPGLPESIYSAALGEAIYINN